MKNSERIHNLPIVPQAGDQAFNTWAPGFVQDLNYNMVRIFHSGFGEEALLLAFEFLFNFGFVVCLWFWVLNPGPHTCFYTELHSQPLSELFEALLCL
jgi:hypothetical protein